MYGRLTRTERGLAYEVIEQGEPTHKRILFRRELAGADAATLAGWAGSAVAWSADGTTVAVAELEPEGLSFFRVESGHRLRTIEGASRPTWAPDGRHVAFYREGTAPGLYVMDENLGEPVRLLELHSTARLPGPAWEQDGRALHVVRVGERRAPGGQARGVTAELLRAPLDGSEPRAIHDLIHQPVVGEKSVDSISMCLDSEGDHLFYVSNIEGQVPQVTWAQLRQAMVYRRFHPLDDTSPAAALALAPRDRKLAMRLGSPTAKGPVALVDPETGQIEPVVPDVRARLEWYALLAGGVRNVLAEGNPAPRRSRQRPSAPPVDRLSLLPAPGELKPGDPLTARLDRIGRVGNQLDGAPSADNLSEPVARSLAEARLVFRYLDPSDPGRRYLESKMALESLEGLVEDPDSRERLVCLRLQLEAGLGELDLVREGLTYLRRNRQTPTARVEEVGDRRMATRLEDPVGAWLSYFEKTLTAPPTDDNEGAIPPRDRDSLVPSPPEPSLEVAPTGNTRERPVIEPIQVLP